MARKRLSLENNPLLRGPSLVSRANTASPYREVPLAEIDFDPNQPRRIFNEEGIKQLADSIREHGVLSPVLVSLGDHGTYRLLAGERRVRASKLAGLSTIPAMVHMDNESDDKTLVKQLVENVQREDLTSMERAIAVGQLRDAYGWSIREIAKRLGVSKAFVQRSLEILALPDDLQAALIAGAAESKVLLLAQIADERTRKKLLIEAEDLTREELNARIQELAQGNSKTYRGGTAKKETSPEDTRLVAELQRALSTKVYLQRKKSKPEQGRIALEFYSKEDLKEIYRRLINN